MAWAEFPKDRTVTSDNTVQDDAGVTVAIQVVKQVNFGPLESKRYFFQVKNGEFVEVTEQWLVNANFQKLNTYVVVQLHVNGSELLTLYSFENYECGMHNKFFEVHVYQRDPINTHHWRADVARPASEIDL